MPPKYSQAVLDYAFDCTTRLGSDTIASATVVVLGGGGTVDRVANARGIVSFWVSGGTPGASISLRCEIITSGGRTFEVRDAIWIYP